ncbi:myosin light chain kinase 2, skeletal/cardiac muscle isoform X2 [Amia ocellicauda]|uniref:myosin light chain kinase 2, skeletal/cardiac muscle isoform X2 n=1 Tax=Amia ocellicauda TaxID=2972642 RepID=UPI003464D32A
MMCWLNIVPNVCFLKLCPACWRRDEFALWFQTCTADLGETHSQVLVENKEETSCSEGKVERCELECLLCLQLIFMQGDSRFQPPGYFNVRRTGRAGRGREGREGRRDVHPSAMGTVKKLPPPSLTQMPRMDLAVMEVKLDCLGRKVDRLLAGQERVPRDAPPQGCCGGQLLSCDVTATLSAVTAHCEQQSQRLETLEVLVQGVQTTLGLLLELQGAKAVDKASYTEQKEHSRSVGSCVAGLTQLRGDPSEKKRVISGDLTSNQCSKSLNSVQVTGPPVLMKESGIMHETASPQVSDERARAPASAEELVFQKGAAHSTSQRGPPSPGSLLTLLPREDTVAKTAIGKLSQMTSEHSAAYDVSVTEGSKNKEMTNQDRASGVWDKGEEAAAGGAAVQTEAQERVEVEKDICWHTEEIKGQAPVDVTHTASPNPDVGEMALSVRPGEKSFLGPSLTPGPALSCGTGPVEPVEGGGASAEESNTAPAATALKRSQALVAMDTSAEPVPGSSAPPGKTGTATDCLDSGGAAGASTEQRHPSLIQIRVSPAERGSDTVDQKCPPKTCLKIIDDAPPQPAPFPHRVVSLRSASPGALYTVNTKEVLGGGRFGRVHKCTEKTSGLKLAAKIINARTPKEKEMVRNEVQVMNQLSHANIIQLYDAFDGRHELVLVMEYVDGGELFERIVDDSYQLTEVDAMVFVKQICEGIHYMHQMYVLQLDLKPENILCVNHTGHQVKIIDFGLARRYKPRDKLRVSFGTPEFLAPEIVNFDFVSFPTDMWALGVMSYMLLSGLSPFLGDDDSQTLNNVLAVNWYFEEEAFEHVSQEARDFISNLLIREKSGRLSAAQCLKHPWLNNIAEKAKHNNICLNSQVLLKKYMARRLWKKNYIAIAAANRFKKISSSGSLTTLGI